MNVRVDQARCVGSANCVRVAPRTFRLTAEGVSEVVDPDGDAPESILEAADGCPMNAIDVRTGTGEAWPQG